MNTGVSHEVHPRDLHGQNAVARGRFNRRRRSDWKTMDLNVIFEDDDLIQDAHGQAGQNDNLVIT